MNAIVRQSDEYLSRKDVCEDDALPDKPEAESSAKTEKMPTGLAKRGWDPYGVGIAPQSANISSLRLRRPSRRRQS